MLTANQVLDLRCGVRFPLELPITIRHAGTELAAQSLNISSAGTLFRVADAIPIGSLIEFTIAMPGHTLRSAKDVLVECTGRVVRCSESFDGHDVAAVIDEYRFKR